MRVLLLPLDGEHYALELEHVREVLVAPPVEPLPGAPPAVRGVANVRGTVVPVLDTARLLALAPPDAAPDHVVVVRVARGHAALTAAGRPGLAELGAPAGRSELPATQGRFAVGAGVATLVDAEALLAPRRLAGAA